MYFGIALALILFLPIIVMSLTDIKERSPYTFVLRAIIVTFVAMILLAGIAGYMGEPLGKLFMDTAETAAKSIAGDETILERLGLSTADAPATEEALLLLYGAFNLLVPSFSLVLISAVAYISYLILYMIKGRERSRLPQMPAVRYFTWPPDLMLGCLLLIGLTLLASSSPEFSKLAVYENLFVIFRVALEFQGIAVFLFFAYNRGLSLPLKGGVLAVLLVTGLGRLLLFVLGLIDYIFGLRDKMLLKS